MNSISSVTFFSYVIKEREARINNHTEVVDLMTSSTTARQTLFKSMLGLQFVLH